MTSRNRWTLIVGIAVAAAVAGGLAYFASSAPDGLEKTQETLGIAPAHPAVAPPPTPFEGYTVKSLGGGFWSSAIAGVAGVLAVLAILLGVGRLLARGKAKAPGAAGT